MLSSLVTLLAAAVAAATPPSAPTATIQTPLIIDQNRLDRTPTPLDRSSQQGEETKHKAISRGDTKVEGEASAVTIRGVNFGGAKVPFRVANAARAYLGKKASKATLHALAKALSDAYANSDIALYTVVIPDQNFRGGIVVVRVAEGFVERVIFTGGMTRLTKAYATALTRQHPLSRHALERYLSFLRDIPGETVDVQVLRGAHPGGVILQIKAKRKRFDVSLGFDNRGQAEQGNAEFNAQAHAFSLLRDGDRTDLTVLATPDFHRELYFGVAHTTPIGDDGMTLALNGGYLDTHPRHTGISGNAKLGGLTFADPIIRGYKKNLTATLGVDLIDSDQATVGSVLSADHTRAARGALGYSDVTGKSVLTAGITVSRGLDILGAHGTPFLSHPVFTKVNDKITYDHTIGQHFIARGRVSAQYSDDPLPAAERFVVGGAEFGRAFDQAVVSGDRGYAGLGELAWRPKLPPKLAAKFAGSELYTFGDYAALKLVGRYPYLPAKYDLGSAGLGARIAFTPRAWLELEGARVIDKPYPGYEGKWRFNISWRLNLKKS
jgi:hemolysin activation/secretion protein